LIFGAPFAAGLGAIKDVDDRDRRASVWSVRVASRRALSAGVVDVVRTS